MSDSSISPELFPSLDNDKPLPLIVAEKWDFPLAYVEGDTYWYSINDWIAGLTLGTINSASRIWTDIQRHSAFKLESIKKLPYRVKDGRIFLRHFTDENGLLVFVARLRVSKTRKRLIDVRNFLATNYHFLKHLSATTNESTLHLISEMDLQAQIVEFILAESPYDQVQTQIKLSSGRTVDMLAKSVHKTVLIECKLDLTGSNLYRAVGQVLIYAKEYEAETGIYPIPVIATVKSELNSAAGESCNLMGIQLWELDIYSENETLLWIDGQQASQFMNMDIATGKPLLQGK